MQLNPEIQLQLLLPSTSSPRLNKYVVRCGHNHERALRMYLWNAQVGEAFHTPIQAAEVSVRNCVNRALIAAFGADWWSHSTFLSLLDRERGEDINQVKRRIANRGITLCTDQVVAGLSLGFWVGILDGRYSPDIWTKHFKVAFPNSPNHIDRRTIQTHMRNMANLRNRISHHEPIFQHDLSKEFRDIMELILWASPDKAKWVRPHCRIQQILREKPK